MIAVSKMCRSLLAWGVGPERKLDLGKETSLKALRIDRKITWVSNQQYLLVVGSPSYLRINSSKQSLTLESEIYSSTEGGS